MVRAWVVIVRGENILSHRYVVDGISIQMAIVTNDNARVEVMLAQAGSIPAPPIGDLRIRCRIVLLSAVAAGAGDRCKPVSTV
jgi:hypothetical protein